MLFFETQCIDVAEKGVTFLVHLVKHQITNHHVFSYVSNVETGFQSAHIKGNKATR